MVQAITAFHQLCAFGREGPSGFAITLLLFPALG